ncbi:hypothetical protein CYMTET_55008 [Cymbomonas tetramitiformis]|uniref:Uncharacterized protein n=1 Tax=Cymbomonas tetramitiformis TaxID=36881 RepID=A0AAE0BEZ1_9CHLO|nr:hypothetical protein CYMTET_55008 [Cymbomonas tetramitiformis]
MKGRGCRRSDKEEGDSEEISGDETEEAQPGKASGGGHKVAAKEDSVERQFEATRLTLEGRGAFMREEYLLAISLLTKAIELEPLDMEARTLRSSAYLALANAKESGEARPRRLPPLKRKKETDEEKEMRKMEREAEKETRRKEREEEKEKKRRDKEEEKEKRRKEKEEEKEKKRRDKGGKGSIEEGKAKVEANNEKVEEIKEEKVEESKEEKVEESKEERLEESKDQQAIWKGVSGKVVDDSSKKVSAWDNFTSPKK